MNSFIAHQDYLKGKNPPITLESLHSSLWSIDDIRNRFNMNGTQRPIAEACLQVIAEKQREYIDKAELKNQIIIETVNKEQQDGKSVDSVSNLSELTIQDEWKHKQLYNDFK